MDAIPVVDLRLLTQAEINALSRASSSAAAGGDSRRGDDDIVIPKIDRSVFNESAGSRKQTYSRLRLAPRKPPDPSSPSPSSSGAAPSGRRRGRPPSARLLPAASPSSSAVAAAPIPPVTPEDPGREENKQIILFLRQLFKKNGIEIGNAAAPREERASVPGTSADANPNSISGALGKRVRELHAAEALGEDRELLNVNGVAVDLVSLGEKEDPFGPEMRRRTQGLVTEEEFLGFLSALEGQWGSRRKRRRMVDAAKIGDLLPKGWKILLALKRKEGNIWLHCRRYISPSGKQFISSKEVSSYLHSFVGSEEVRQQNATQSSTNKFGIEHKDICHSQQVNITNGCPSFPAAIPRPTLFGDSGKQTGLSGLESALKAQLQGVSNRQACNLTFADKVAHMQHSQTFHTSSRNRRKLGQSIGDGVIIRDGKYECQFCHKIFTERRRYTGHVGSHVKNHGKSLVQATNETTLDKNVASSSDGAASSFGDHSISVGSGGHAELIEKNISTKSIHVINVGHPHGDEPTGNIVIDHTLKCYGNETEKIMAHETCSTGDIGEIKNNLPLNSSDDIDKERNEMQDICPLTNDETNEGSSRDNVSLDKRKIEHNMKCSDIEISSVQEVCNTQCVGEINDGSTLGNNQNKLNRVDYFPSSHNETSESRFIDRLTNDYSMTDQKPRKLAETGNHVNGDTHIWLDSACQSHSDVENLASEGPPSNYFSNKPINEMEKTSCAMIAYERHSIGVSDGLQAASETVMSSGFGIDGGEDCANKVCLSSNLNILPSKEQNNTGNSIATCLTEELAEMAKPGDESENGLERVNTTSHIALSLDNIMHDKIQSPGTEKRLLENLVMIPSSKIYCDMDTATGDVLPSTGEEIMFDITDQSSNELKVDFISDNRVVDADSLRNDIGISDEQNMQNLPINMQASWGPTSAHLPILDMISGQTDGHLHHVNQSREKISCSEDARLDKIKPQRSLFSTDQDSRQQLEEENPYTPLLENGPHPCIQLEWDLASPSFSFRRRITTFCVWCSTEFEHDDFDIEVQPDSVGLMCPTCKAKISGQM